VYLLFEDENGNVKKPKKFDPEKPVKYFTETYTGGPESD
jgi:hypothetical protein